MTNNNKHPAWCYLNDVLSGKINAPKYVKIQVQKLHKIYNNESTEYVINYSKVTLISKLLKIMVMPKGLKANKSLNEVLSGFQWFFIVSVLCIVHKNNNDKRRFETAILEIARKNGKTLLIAIIFILLFFLEPKFSKFFSVAPDGSLSRLLKQEITEIIISSPALSEKFKIRRDDILCYLNQNNYFPLNYSNSKLDGKLPSAFLIDETGALPNNYAIEAMRSGQLTILNKLGCIISTKYPTVTNPFEEEVDLAKRVLNDIKKDDKIFALLYEPDNNKDWTFDDEILIQANPLAIDVTEIMVDLLQKRGNAIDVPSRRENFLTKHCNIIYQGVGTESFVDIKTVINGRIKDFVWSGRNVYLGLDLSISNDNCSYSMLCEVDGIIYCESVAFIPEDSILEKSKIEKVDYQEYIRKGVCYACGDKIIDYLFIENMIGEIEAKYNVNIKGVAYDRYNCMSTAQKLESKDIPTVEVKQHSSVLHPATKLLYELILDSKFKYLENELLEINFQNAKCTFDTNQNRYVNKKKSSGKIDMVVSIINAMFLLQQDVYFGSEMEWGAMVI